MMRKKDLFTLPLPSSALSDGGVAFRVRPHRAVVLVCSWDDRPAGPLALVFESVEALKCTYHKACTVEQIRLAYDTVVDLGASGWLREIAGRHNRGEAADLRHLMIYFDDGPCYEFICRGLRVEDHALHSQH